MVCADIFMIRMDGRGMQEKGHLVIFHDMVNWFLVFEHGCFPSSSMCPPEGARAKRGCFSGAFFSCPSASPGGFCVIGNKVSYDTKSVTQKEDLVNMTEKKK